MTGWWVWLVGVVDGLPSHRNPVWFRDSYVLKQRVEKIVNHQARRTNQPLLEVMWHNVPAYNQTCWERKNKQIITKDMEKQQQQIDDSCKTQMKSWIRGSVHNKWIC